MKWTKYNKDVDANMFCAHHYLVYNKKLMFIQIGAMNPINRKIYDVRHQTEINKEDIEGVISYQELEDELLHTKR